MLVYLFVLDLLFHFVIQYQFQMYRSGIKIDNVKVQFVLVMNIYFPVDIQF